MQINKISNQIPKNINKKNNDVSFKGAASTGIIMSAIDKTSLGVANAIENGGLFVSFTLQDMLGTNLPRPLMGLKRNAKENKGQANKKFAAKELVREMLTGPSMFIIPGAMLAVAKNVFGKTINIPMKAINALSTIHSSATAVVGKEEFVQNAFTTIIKNAKSESAASEETINKAKEFAKQLVENAKDKDVINKISDEFIDISKKFAKDPAHTDFTVAKLSSNTSASIKDAISYITAYADDIVVKTANVSPDKITEKIKSVTNKKILGRFAMNAAMYAAVMSFLHIIPKLYNKAEGKGNAGLKGLMKEETLSHETQKDEAKQVKTDKANPSFGSSTGLSKILTENPIVSKVAGGLEFSGCNLSFPLLLGVMGFGILLPRTRQAKDEYDREEILRRDVVTCATMCFGEKELRKGFSKINEKSSGLVLAAKEQGFKNKNIFLRLFDYLRPENGVRVLSTEQIVSKYSGIDKYKDGIKGFCEFIENQGGDLKKVFSLTDESKALLESILSKQETTLADADNSIIKNAMEKAKDSDEIKKLTDLFKDKNNPWVTKAKTLNARFTALSVLILVPVFLGFLLPWINEKSTKKKIAARNAQQANNQAKTVDFAFQANTSKVFSDIAKFK